MELPVVQNIGRSTKKMITPKNDYLSVCFLSNISLGAKMKRLVEMFLLRNQIVCKNFEQSHIQSVQIVAKITYN